MENLENIVKAIVTLQDGKGRGVIIGKKYILTAAHNCRNHNCRNKEEIIDNLERVKFDGIEKKIALLFCDEVKDIAILGVTIENEIETIQEFQSCCEGVPYIKPEYVNFQNKSKVIYTYGLDGKWIEGKVIDQPYETGQIIMKFDKSLFGGESGGPVVTNEGKLFGLVLNDQYCFLCALNLPYWLHKELNELQS